jgi:hypothetical protein
MQSVTITGLVTVRDLKPSADGHTILAYFSADVGVFSFKGCLLVRTARRGIAAWLPRLDDKRAHGNRSVTLNDEPTRNALLQAARDTYRLMGGKHAEYEPRDDDAERLHPYRGSDEKGWPTHPLHPNYTAPENNDAEDRGGLKTFLEGSIG